MRRILIICNLVCSINVNNLDYVPSAPANFDQKDVKCQELPLRVPLVNMSSVGENSKYEGRRNPTIKEQ
jgi:hypothetical protein